MINTPHSQTTQRRVNVRTFNKYVFGFILAKAICYAKAKQMLSNFMKTIFINGLSGFLENCCFDHNS
jgi:hypothetical protein